VIIARDAEFTLHKTNIHLDIQNSGVPTKEHIQAFKSFVLEVPEGKGKTSIAVRMLLKIINFGLASMTGKTQEELLSFQEANLEQMNTEVEALNIKFFKNYMKFQLPTYMKTKGNLGVFEKIQTLEDSFSEIANVPDDYIDEKITVCNFLLKLYFLNNTMYLDKIKTTNKILGELISKRATNAQDELFTSSND
jgi:hypothetical protein